MGRAGRARVEHDFTVARNVADTLDVYRRAVARAKRRRPG
jgi:hypothetical protein